MVIVQRNLWRFIVFIHLSKVTFHLADNLSVIENFIKLAFTTRIRNQPSCFDNSNSCFKYVQVDDCYNVCPKC
jgi:hypothetical protein